MKNRMTLQEDILSMLISPTPFKWGKNDCIKLCQEKQMKNRKRKNPLGFPFEARSNKEFLLFNNLSLSWMWQLRVCTRTAT